jgi:hypothetical protein
MKAGPIEVGKDSLRIGILPNSPVPRMLILTVLAVMAVISTYVAVKEGAFSDSATEAIDFQWSGSHLLSQHENPWQLYIQHKDQGKIILGQQPNYLAELFLILLPLGRMSFPVAAVWWCGLNLAFAAGILYAVRRMFSLDRDHTLLVTFLLMASMPFRVTLHNGQHGLFILLMLCLTFLPRNLLLKGLALGVSYSKYSFAPLIVMMLIVKRRLGIVLISVIPPLVGLLIAWHMLGGSLLSLGQEPFDVAKMAMGPGMADIMTPLEFLLRRLSVEPSLIFSLPAALGMLAAAISAIWIGRSKRMTEELQFAVALVLTLICLKHVNYDFVVLVVPVAAAVMAPRSKARAIVLLCALHFWFLTPIIGHVFSAQRVYVLEVVIYGLLLLAMAIATSRLYPTIEADAGLVPASE